MFILERSGQAYFTTCAFPAGWLPVQGPGHCPALQVVAPLQALSILSSSSHPSLDSSSAHRPP